MGNGKYKKQGFDIIVELNERQSVNEYTWKKPTTVFVNSMSDLFTKILVMIR
jgi:protein gp37